MRAERADDSALVIVCWRGGLDVTAVASSTRRQPVKTPHSAVKASGEQRGGAASPAQRRCEHGCGCGDSVQGRLGGPEAFACLYTGYAQVWH